MTTIRDALRVASNLISYILRSMQDGSPNAPQADAGAGREPGAGAGDPTVYYSTARALGTGRTRA